MSEIITANRRSFLKRLSLGAAGIAAGSLALPTSSSALFGGGKSEVSLIASKDTRQATYDSLKAISKDIVKAIGNKRVIIKANAGITYENAKKNSTDVEQLRGILDFLKEEYGRPVTVAEGVATPALPVSLSYENYGYYPLEKEYDCTLMELNDQPTVRHFITSGSRKPQPINVISTFFDPDVYWISATRMKSHNAVLVTLSTKNMVMGSPICHYKSKDKNGRNEKGYMHGGAGSQNGRELSYNLFHLADQGVRPDLAVLDGVQGIEGDGPWGGEIIEQGVALASTDFVAADRLAIELMGVDPKEIKYVQWLGEHGYGQYDLSKIKVKGPDYKKHIMKYRLNKTADEQRAWIYENDLYEK